MKQTISRSETQDPLIRRASFSRCRNYRYSLTRIWAPDQRQLVIIGLNPSTADGFQDDPTIRRCMGLSRTWGFGGFVLVNLFSWRSPDPAELKMQSDPVGRHTNRVVRRVLAGAPAVVAMWGNHGHHQGRDQVVLKLLKQSSLWSVGQTSTGAPRHLLYVRRDAKLSRYPLP